MTFALIEVEAVAKKAARGAGYSWGMAEEAAKATRVLCGLGLDGVAALATVLTAIDGKALADATPATLDGDWRGNGAPLCPVSTGATLSDSAALWATEGKRIETITAPLLLVPFAMNAARQLGRTVTLSWPGFEAVTDGTATAIRSERDPRAIAGTDDVTVATGGALDGARAPGFRAAPSDEAWAVLGAFAARTHAPDTDESRQKGAGAGLSDND